MGYKTLFEQIKTVCARNSLNDNPIHIKNGMKNDFQIVKDHSEIGTKADSE